MWKRIIKSIAIPIFLGLMLLFSVGFRTIEVCCECICAQIAPEGCPMEQLSSDSFAGSLLNKVLPHHTSSSAEGCACSGENACSDCAPEVEVLHLDSYVLPEDHSDIADLSWLPLSDIEVLYASLQPQQKLSFLRKTNDPPLESEGRGILARCCVLRI